MLKNEEGWSKVENLEVFLSINSSSIEILDSLLLNENKLDVKTIFAHLVVEEKKHLALLEELKTKI